MIIIPLNQSLRGDEREKKLIKLYKTLNARQKKKKKITNQVRQVTVWEKYLHVIEKELILLMH